MNKILFRKIVCLVIALLMMMPVVPSNKVSADESFLENPNDIEQLMIESSDQKTLEEKDNNLIIIQNSITSPAAFMAVPLGDESNVGIQFGNLVKALDELFSTYEITLTIGDTDVIYGEKITQDSQGDDLNWIGVPFGSYKIHINAGNTHVSVVSFKQSKDTINISDNILVVSGTAEIQFTEVVLSAISLDKEGSLVDEDKDGYADAGEFINYTFRVKNEGHVSLTNVMVTDPKATVLGSPITLIQGETNTTTFTASYIIKQSDIDAGKVDNTASVVGYHNQLVISDSDTETVALNQDAAISLLKNGIWIDANSNYVADEGEVINYSFTVKNEGNVPLINVNVTDLKAAVSGGPISLNPGDTDNTTFVASYQITPDDIKEGMVDNTATVRGTFKSTTVIDTSKATVLLNNVKIPLTITAKNQTKAYGDTFTFEGTEFTVDGLVGTDKVTSVSLASEGSVSTAIVGNYIININDAAGTGLDKYDITYVPGTLKIIPKELTITADAKSKTYGDIDPKLTYEITVGELVGQDALTGELKRVVGETVGKYQIQQGSLGNSNYTITYVPADLTITAKAITITAKSESKEYDETPLIIDGYDITAGVLKSDHIIVSVKVTGAQLYIGSSDNIPSNAVIKDGEIDVTPNYAISYVNGTLTVTEAPPINIHIVKYWYDNEEEPVIPYFTLNTVEENSTVRPQNITFKLWIGEQEVDSLTLQNGETYGMFSEKPKYDSEGEKINYRVTEDSVLGYESTVEGPHEDGDLYVHVTNTIKQFNIIYNANSGSGTMADKNSPYTYGADVTVLANEFTRSNYGFRGWNTEADGSGTAYAAGASFTMPANDVTLYAQWQGKSKPKPPIIIENPEVLLPDLEKEDHFAYVIGYPDGEVKPGNNITREEVAMIFYRLLTDDSRDEWLSDVNTFTDVVSDRWSNRAISTLYNAGIIKGYPDGTFGPSDPISRAEFATIAAKFDKLELQDTSRFTDIFGHWAEKYITSSEIKGWIKGYPDLTFRAEQDITRAEAMTLINNVLERTVPEENIHPDAMFWPDINSDDWYYEAVMEATNSHDYIYEKDEDELWTGMKANKVWP